MNFTLGYNQLTPGIAKGIAKKVSFFLISSCYAGPATEQQGFFSKDLH